MLTFYLAKMVASHFCCQIILTHLFEGVVLQAVEKITISIKRFQYTFIVHFFHLKSDKKICQFLKVVFCICADDDFEAMDIDEDDVFLPGNYIHCTFPIHLHDNSDSDSEMENIIKQNLIFENRNFSPHERPIGACANERDINANTCTNSCSSQTVKQNGDVAHPMNSLRKRPCASVTREFCRHAVCTDNITQADESGSVRAILGEVPGMSIAIFVLLISGYTFMALKLSLNPGTFVCVELFVEFLILILRLLLD